MTKRKFAGGMPGQLLLPAVFSFALLAGCAPSNESGPASGNSSAPSAQENTVITELQIIDIDAGEGEAIQSGQGAIVHYTGWLHDTSAPENRGKQFDSSAGREPIAFSLGAGQVIPGWEQGIQGMQVGGKRVLIIPPNMAYGDRGAGSLIPPNSALVFEVELVGIQ